ncbi:MAG: hypothetical protein LC650_02905, partial [Actinobacteria bacterium]|nr:hypothetical protein [Actinomycetota bacterium]
MDCVFGGDATQGDVWYSFEAPEGILTIETSALDEEAEDDTQMQVLDGCDGAVLGCSEDEGEGLASLLVFECGDLTPGETYLIQLDGYAGLQFDFNLSLSVEECPSCTPASELITEVIADDCADGEGSYTVALSFSDDGSAEEYTLFNDVNEETAVVAADDSVEFSFPSGTEVNFTAVATGFQDCIVEGSASFTCPTPAPINDNCDGAVQIACDQPVSGSTIDATAGNTSPSCVEGSVQDLFYTFDAIPGIEYTVSVDGESNYDAVLALYSGACSDEENWIELGCEDATFSGGIESASISVDEPTSIIVQTYDWFSDGGDFELSISCVEPAPVPSNDLPCDAITVECGSVVDGSNEGATPDARCASDNERLGVWYTLELDTEQIVSLETCLGQTNFDTDLSVFTGSCDDLTCFDGFDGDGHIDGDSECEVQSWAAGGDGAIFTAPAGTYYIMVHGFGATTSGDFTLSVSCESPEPVCDADGGFIGFADESDAQTVCADDAGSIEVIQSGATGEAFAWVITDEDANVLDLPDGPPFDFSDAETGTVLIWYLAFDP